MIYISSLLPNPAGPDAEGERIVIKNDGATAVSLNGWVIKDDSGKNFKIGEVTIKSGEEVEFLRSQTKITLGNNGDTVTLYDNTGRPVDRLSYTRVVKDDELIQRGDSSGKDAIALLEPSARFGENSFALANISEAFWSILIAVGITFAVFAFFILRNLPRDRK